MSQIKKDNNLQKKVEGLIRENKNLKKKLSKLRKVANDGVKQSKPKEVVKAKKDPQECDSCRGEIKKISIYNLEFDICQKCKTRTRIK